jgi:hypothetical protein
LTVDFLLEEVPFPTKEVSSSEFLASDLDDEDLSESSDFAVISESEFTNINLQNFENAETQPKSQNRPETWNLKPETDLVELIANMPSKMPPISSEDLEHVEDSWLDEAYEMKLMRTGDDLFPIKNASKIIEVLLGADFKTEVSAKIEASNGGAATATAPAREKLIFTPPVFETETDSEEIPELPENPTEEQLWHYAENHPLTKKVMRAFRGKLVEVKKL